MEVCVLSSLLAAFLCVGMYGKSTYAEECSDPVLTPSSLLVEYGSPAEVNCSISYKPAEEFILGWESQSSVLDTETEMSVLWKVDSLTNWQEPEAIRCYFSPSLTCQRASRLNLTIYKRPDSVTLRSSNVLLEGDLKELMCEIKNVGPGHRLSVRWSRMDPKINNNFTEFNEMSFSDLEKKNVTVTASTNITLNSSDDGTRYQCAAVLNLKEHALEFVTTSEPITITVQYKPIIQHLEVVQSAETKERLVINCTAIGNPSPHYEWTLPNKSVISNLSSLFIISSVQMEDQGLYICTARNYLGNESRKVTVKVKTDYTIYIIIGAGIILLLLSLATVSFLMRYRDSRMGRYILNQLRPHNHRSNVDHNTEDRAQL